jgi:DNA-binding transcriptional LysR family regulator
MNLEYLRYFITITDERSISKAAFRLHLSQSALTQILQKLESEWACELLVRSNRGVTPTRFGSLLYDYGSEMLKTADALHEQIESLKNEATTVSFKHCCSLNNDMLPQLFYQIQTSFPAVKLHVEILDKAKIIREIEQGITDFGIFLGDTKGMSGLSVTYVGTERIVLAAGISHEVPAHIAVGRLVSERLIDFSIGSYMKLIREQLETQCDHSSLKGSYEPFMRLDSLSAIKGLVQKNVGLAFLPLSSIATELESGKLRVVEVDGVDLVLDVKVVTRKDADLALLIQRMKSTFLFLAEGYLLRTQIC